MFKKIFRLKIALLVVVVDVGLLLLFPWGWGGYCPGLFGYSSEGGALGLCVSQAETVAADTLLILVGVTLVIFSAYIIFVGSKKILQIIINRK